MALFLPHLLPGVLATAAPVTNTLLIDLLFIIGLLVAFGVAAEFISKGTEKFESLVGQGMAGGVVLGFMGSLPETIFVIIAVTTGSYAVAIGTALGGNVILFTMGIGLVAVGYFAKWRKNIVMKEDYHVELWFLVLSTFAMLLLIIYGRLDVASGILLFLIYVGYVGYRYAKVHSRVMMHMNTANGRKIFIEGIGLIAIGIAIVVLLSGFFIQEIITISGFLGIAAIWLALVITPLASDFVDQLSAYRLAQRNSGGGSTAIVSFIGAKIQNNTILLGVIGIFAIAPVTTAFALPEFIAVIVINCIALAVLSRGRFSYLEGLVFIALYFVTIIGAFII